MTIKSILCIFGGSQSELNALSTASVLGHTYGARVRVLHISSDPHAYAGVYGEGVVVSAAIIESIENENMQRLNKARQYVASVTAKYHIPLDTAEVSAHHASAQFIHFVGAVDPVVAREGRLSDLIIIGRGVTPANDLMTPALFNTGRPVLLMPSAHGDLSGEWQDKTVALAWNGSLQAARALFNALPLLERAEKVYVLTVEEHDHDLATEVALMEYLRAHGIQAQGVVVAAGERSHGEALLLRAKELKSDLLVMGAYGHSMFREMVLGGVTEHMLQKADIPLLLSH